MKQSLCCRHKTKSKWTICARLASSVDPRLLGAYAERGWGCGGVCWRVWLRWKNGCNASVCVSLCVESCSWKMLISFAAPYAFYSLFFLSKRLNDIHVTWFDWFYVERVTAHRIKINDYSCFHNLWPNSKTKLKWKYLWEQGVPWCFGGPT